MQGLLLGHALLGTQLAQLGDHGLQHVLVVHSLEAGALQVVQAQFLAASQNGVLVAHDDEVHDLALKQVVGRLDDAVLLAFGQHDGLLVALGLAEQAELGGVRGDGRGGVHIERGEHFIGGSVLTEGLQRQILGGFIGERHLRKSPDRQAVLGEGLLNGGKRGAARIRSRRCRAPCCQPASMPSMDSLTVSSSSCGQRLMVHTARNTPAFRSAATFASNS